MCLINLQHIDLYMARKNLSYHDLPDSFKRQVDLKLKQMGIDAHQKGCVKQAVETRKINSLDKTKKNESEKKIEASKNTKMKSSSREVQESKSSNEDQKVTVSLPSSLPHKMLWNLVQDMKGVKLEHPLGIPGRRYRGDIAFPDVKLVVEVDGWQHHGKYLSDFERDRVRQNLLTLNGWRILRFTAGQIRKDAQLCRQMVEQAINSKSPQESHDEV